MFRRELFRIPPRLARQLSSNGQQESGPRWSHYSAAAGAVISTGASLVAMYSAYDTRRNLDAQQRKEFGRAFANLQDSFYTIEMNRAQRKLYNLKKRADNEGRSWDDVCAEWAADDLALVLTPVEKLSKQQQIRMKEVEDIEEARRNWSAFYIKFRSLYKRGVISEEDVKQHHFPSETQMKGYISVVDAMEHACSVIFVGNDKYITRYKQAKVAGFLDSTFLGGGFTPNEAQLKERNEKYLLIRKNVLEKMKR